MTKLVLAPHAAMAIKLLEENGFEAFVVGGCVRDILMGKTPADWDITTNATPNETVNVFASYKIIEIGREHGTIAVITAAGILEITTYRTDGTYSDSRHPDSIAFVKSIENDLARRDFTINAMAYNQKTGLVDLFGGTDDLRDGIIRCVGDPKIRFSEDALRIMRAARFSAQLGFCVETASLAAAVELAGNLQRISPQRIVGDFEKILLSQNPEKAFVNCSQLLSALIPNCKNPASPPLINVLGQLPKSLPLRLAAFAQAFSGDGNPTITLGEIARCLPLQKGYCEEAAVILAAGLRPIPSTKPELKRLLRDFGGLCYLNSLYLSAVKNRTSLNPIAIVGQVAEIMAAKECFSLSALAINGGDLIAIGIPQGERIGDALNQILELVIDDALQNEKSALLAKARELTGV